MAPHSASTPLASCSFWILPKNSYINERHSIEKHDTEKHDIEIEKKN